MQKPQLFKQILGEKTYETLPEAIHFFHENAEQEWQGTARITGDNNLILRIIRKLNGLPVTNPQIPVKISVSYQENREIWHRQFGKFRFTSSMGIDSSKQLLYEKVGLLRFYFRPNIHPFPEDSMRLASHWDFKYATILGIKIPRFLSPFFIGRESISPQNIYQFKAYVRLPFIGVLVDYEGSLYPPEKRSKE